MADHAHDNSSELMNQMLGIINWRQHLHYPQNANNYWNPIVGMRESLFTIDKLLIHFCSAFDWKHTAMGDESSVDFRPQLNMWRNKACI